MLLLALLLFKLSSGPSAYGLGTVAAERAWPDLPFKLGLCCEFMKDHHWRVFLRDPKPISYAVVAHQFRCEALHKGLDEIIDHNSERLGRDAFLRKTVRVERGTCAQVRLWSAAPVMILCIR